MLRAGPGLPTSEPIARRCVARRFGQSKRTAHDVRTRDERSLTSFGTTTVQPTPNQGANHPLVRNERMRAAYHDLEGGKGV